MFVAGDGWAREPRPYAIAGDEFGVSRGASWARLFGEAILPHPSYIAEIGYNTMLVRSMVLLTELARIAYNIGGYGLV